MFLQEPLDKPNLKTDHFIEIITTQVFSMKYTLIHSEELHFFSNTTHIYIKPQTLSWAKNLFKYFHVLLCS